jgi:hypothetical protein
MKAKRCVVGLLLLGLAAGCHRHGASAVPATSHARVRPPHAPVPIARPLAGSFAADPTWLSVASSLVASPAPCFQQCTTAPLTGQRICLGHVPGVAVGGVGQSSDPAVPVSCFGGGDLFGCEVGAPDGAAESCQPAGAIAPLAGARFPNVVDNETAAVAAEAAKRGLRFIGFRGMSDGEADPLNLPGFPAQFFVYYRLAARNSAAAAVAFVERVGRHG